MFMNKYIPNLNHTLVDFVEKDFLRQRCASIMNGYTKRVQTREEDKRQTDRHMFVRFADHHS
jgi:hypothetical protein